MATTEASVKSALQRARATMDERLPDRSQQATLRALGDARIQAIVGSYTDAFERGDVDAIVGLLGDDAELVDAAVPAVVLGPAIRSPSSFGPGPATVRLAPSGHVGQWPAGRGLLSAGTSGAAVFVGRRVRCA